MSIILEDSICAVDDIARNEVPQLSKTEATMAKNQNSIGVRYREKTGSVGGLVILWPDETSMAWSKSSEYYNEDKADSTIL